MKNNIVSKEFTLNGKNASFTVLHKCLQNDLLKDPWLLINLASDRDSALNNYDNCQAADIFLENGHRVLSFDLPNHGERINKYGSGIEGMRNAFAAGHNPFEMFLEDSREVVDECIKRGLATAYRIAVSGISRGGYLAMRLMAADSRISQAVAFSPVTDWTILNEFSQHRQDEAALRLNLSSYIHGLVGKPVFMCIGNHDDRVGTFSCCRLYLELAEANERNGSPRTLIDFYCTDDANHTCGHYWYEKGAEFLIKHSY